MPGLFPCRRWNSRKSPHPLNSLPPCWRNGCRKRTSTTKSSASRAAATPACGESPPRSVLPMDGVPRKNRRSEQSSPPVYIQKIYGPAAVAERNYFIVKLTTILKRTVSGMNVSSTSEALTITVRISSVWYLSPLFGVA